VGRPTSERIALVALATAELKRLAKRRRRSVAAALAVCSERSAFGGLRMKKLNAHQIFTAVIGSMAVAAFMTSIMVLVRLTLA